MAVVLTIEDHHVPISLFVTGHGEPAPINGLPVWKSLDESIMTVVAAEDGMSATISAVGVGQTQGVVELTTEIVQPRDVIAHFNVAVLNAADLTHDMHPGHGYFHTSDIIISRKLEQI